MGLGEAVVGRDSNDGIGVAGDGVEARPDDGDGDWRGSGACADGASLEIARNGAEPGGDDRGRGGRGTEGIVKAGTDDDGGGLGGSEGEATAILLADGRADEQGAGRFEAVEGDENGRSGRDSKDGIGEFVGGQVDETSGCVGGRVASVNRDGGDGWSRGADILAGLSRTASRSRM